MKAFQLTNEKNIELEIFYIQLYLKNFIFFAKIYKNIYFVILKTFIEELINSY